MECFGVPATFFEIPPTPTSLSLIRAEFPHLDSDSALETNQEAIEPLASAPEPDLAECDRFLIVSPYAAGGQGQVFIARDQQLNRDVALKELKPKHADKALSRARFLREAEIAGGLEHPGVVPVYALGKHVDGRPFYAMRLIKGRTMHQWIRDFHRPQTPIPQVERNVRFRQLLQRFISVCQTIAFAHSRGILHRDIKPSNVLIGDFGEAIVVDWGLARRFNELAGCSFEDENPSYSNPDSDSRADTTMMGSALGTPAFMSPEQAEGRWDHVGPPSDVYSLGATLYVLLTGQLPLKNMAWEEMSRRIRTGDIPSPRQIAPWVSRGLDAICRKAMAINPIDRYASAKELAEDVERWLADEPVLAAPEPYREKVRRWIRRHRIFVTTLGAILVVTSIALGAGLFFVDRERQHTVQALDIAKKERKTAKDALNELTSNVIDQWLTGQDELLPEHREFLQRTLEKLQAFANEKPDDAEGHLHVARAYRRVGEIQGRLGKPADAQKSLQEGEKRLQQVSLPADDVNLMRERGSMNSSIGKWHRENGQLDESESRFATARDIFEKLTQQHPHDADLDGLLVQSWNNHAAALADQNKLESAAIAFAKALERRRQQATLQPQSPTPQRELIRTLNNFGTCQSRRPGHIREAEAMFRDAADRSKSLVQSRGRHTEDMELWAAAETKLGALLLMEQRFDEAEQRYQIAIATTEQLLSRYPLKMEYAQDLASLRSSLAGIHVNRMQWTEVVEQCDIALAIAKNSIGMSQPNYRWQTIIHRATVRRSDARSRMAMNYLQANDRDEALRIADELMDDKNAACVAIYNVACIYCQAGVMDRALAALQRSAQLGYFRGSPATIQHLDEDKDLAPLREHPGYSQFRQSLSTDSAAPAKK
jgi:serine/threonine-protein kinase